MNKKNPDKDQYDHYQWEQKHPYHNRSLLNQIAQEICGQYPLTSQTLCILSFYPYAGLKSTIRIDKKKTLFRISDILEDAPAGVLCALLHILIARASRTPPPQKYQQIYVDYITKPAMEKKHAQVRRKRHRKQLNGPQGVYYNLEEVFTRVNRHYFNSELKQPELSWSPGRSRTLLGYHDGHLNLIVISRWLDRKTVPQEVVDFIMYHELLHIVIPTRCKNGRRMIHTPEFRRREQEFKEYEEAIKWLKHPRLRLVP
jgi:hypothetical protein